LGNIVVLVKDKYESADWSPSPTEAEPPLQS
jgi:hypothetical protein